VAVLGLAHTRKLPAEDPLEEISGTLGLAGAADAALVLRRERGRHDATLHCTGRDLEEQELALRWDSRYCLWSVIEQAEEYRLSQERSQALDLPARQGPLTPAQVAELTGRPRSSTKRLLWQMGQGGQAEVDERGRYSVASVNRANRANRPGEGAEEG
jgi:hypothetical protein